MTSTLPQSQEALAYLKNEVCADWKSILDGAFGSSAFPLLAPAPTASTEDRLWFAYSFAPVRFGSVTFVLARSTALALGHRLLAAKGRASEHEHHAIHAMGHLMSQLATSLARRLSSRLNTPVESAESADSKDAPVSADEFAIAFASAENESHLLTVSPSTVLIAALADAFSSASTTALAPGSFPAPRNLDLLLDLEMPVSVSFGSTRLLLRDVATFAAGSIVELNRPVSEPVEIVVNNCSIARGEVVVVDGNFAVRIKQIISKQERLRSLS